MNYNQVVNSFMRLLGAVAVLIRRGWRPLVAFLLTISVLQLSVTGPMLAMLIDRLVKTSGERAIGNLDIVAFLMSPAGLLFLLLFAFVIIVVSLLALAGLMQIGQSSIEGQRNPLALALRQLRARAWHIVALAGVAVLVLGVILAPALLLLYGVHASLLTEHDINYYLSSSPPEFKLALGLGLLIVIPVLLALAVQVAVLLFALPFVLFEGQGARVALRSSRALLAGHKGRVLKTLVLLLLMLVVLSAMIHALIYLGTKLVIAPASLAQPLLLLVLGASLATSLLSSTAMTWLAECVLVFAVLLIWRQRRGLSITMLPMRSQPAPGRYWPSFAAPLLALLAVLAGSYYLFNSIQLEDHVFNVAHRGSSIDAPENLLSAVKQAAIEGADAAEIDVQRSADGIIVVAHDRDMMRIAGSPLVINATDAAQLRRLDVGSRIGGTGFAGEPIATLGQVVSYAKSVGLALLIELKSYDDDGERLAREVIALLDAQGVVDHAIVMSLEYAEVRYFRHHFPNVRSGYLASAAIGDLTRLDADFLAVSQGVLSNALISTLHHQAKKVCVWTIDDRQTMAAMIDRGVDCIITNRPDRLRALLEQHRGLSSIERMLLRYRQLLQ